MTAHHLCKGHRGPLHHHRRHQAQAEGADGGGGEDKERERVPQRDRQGAKGTRAFEAEFMNIFAEQPTRSSLSKLNDHLRKVKSSHHLASPIVNKKKTTMVAYCAPNILLFKSTSLFLIPIGIYTIIF